MKKSKQFQPDEDQIKEEELRRRAHKLHIELFPEEYDHMFDSISDGKERRRGVNPMSAEYIAATNERRVQLGFEPFAVGTENTTQDTYRWVMDKLRAGDEDNLLTRKAYSEQAAVKADLKAEEERAELQTPAWQDQKIDEMLASSSFLHGEENRDDPHVISFRILGEIFQMNPSNSSKKPFHAQIRRVMPGKTEAEYAELFRRALAEWTEAYGY